MKTVNKILRVLTVVFGLASLVLFFTNFVTIVTDADITLVGAKLAFGGEVDFADTPLAKSADILLCFWLTVIGLALSIFSFKSKKLRYAAPGFGLATTIYMLVVLLAGPFKFVDVRPLAYSDITSMTYTPFVLFTVIALGLFTIAGIAHLFLDDYIEVLESKGEKLTIAKRVIRFLKDYKSEYKKIVWPGWRDVLKNTVIVLIMCLIIGALIWIVDFGLGKLLELILTA